MPDKLTTKPGMIPAASRRDLGSSCQPPVVLTEGQRAAASTAVVGPLEQKILEILSGKFNRGHWPPPDDSFVEAAMAIRDAGGGLLKGEAEMICWDDDEWINALAALARKVDESYPPTGRE